MSLILRVLLTAMLGLPGLTSCALSAPPCSTQAALADQDRGPAGCLVVVDRRMLVVRDRSSGRLGFPAGGARAGESSRCTAYRETWEETGIDARVGDLLKVFANGFRLYHCHVETAVGPGDETAVPGRAILEISEICWVDPGSLAASEWRYPEMWPEVLEIYSNLGDDPGAEGSSEP